MIALQRLFTKTAITGVAAALALGVPAAQLATPAPAYAQSGEQATLDRATKALRAITTMRADFVQSDRNGRSVKGKLTLKNPGKIRFEYGDDTNMLVVSNGSMLTLVDYDVQQVERWPIGNSPLGALLDPARDITKYGKALSTASSAVTSIEVSDPSKPEYGVITLIFVKNPSAPGGLELASWVALDAQNVRTTVRLTNHRYGMAVPDSTFRFRDPRRTTRRPG
tara:strand:+ start:321 stop:992 length:672 start_codon:yes stop_codon:yes gene_type:complete